MNDPKPKQVLKCVWRRVDTGWLLSSPMWWVAYAGKSANASTPPFFWKHHGGEVHYANSLEAAKAEAEKCVLAGFDEYQYEITNVIHSTLRQLANTFTEKKTPELLFGDKDSKP